MKRNRQEKTPADSLAVRGCFELSGFFGVIRAVPAAAAVAAAAFTVGAADAPVSYTHLGVGTDIAGAACDQNCHVQSLL